MDQRIATTFLPVNSPSRPEGECCFCMTHRTPAHAIHFCDLSESAQHTSCILSPQPGPTAAAHFFVWQLRVARYRDQRHLSGMPSWAHLCGGRGCDVHLWWMGRREELFRPAHHQPRPTATPLSTSRVAAVGHPHRNVHSTQWTEGPLCRRFQQPHLLLRGAGRNYLLQ